MEEKFRCPVYKKCGGCQLDVTYPQQLSYKQRLVDDLLGAFCDAEDIRGMEDPFHYRCKVSTAFGYSGGRVVSGVWQSSAGRLVNVENCALEHEEAGKITAAAKALLRNCGLKTYDPRTGQGYLRFITVRVGKATGEIMVVLGVGGGKNPGKERFAQELVKKCPQITTLVENISMGRLNLVPGRQERVLYGPGYITDRLCGCTFRISPRSFFQVNPVQTEVLYGTAAEFSGLKAGETVIDAYCGVGTIGMIAAKKAKEVLGVESNGEAVENARENVRRNGVKNMKILKGDAGEFMEHLAEEGKTVDAVFTDPPRAGCSRQFLTALAKLAPKKVVYVSCNPEAQARDIKFLVRNGYAVKRLRPVDMFPYTRHVETVALLEKREKKNYR